MVALRKPVPDSAAFDTLLTSALAFGGELVLWSSDTDHAKAEQIFAFAREHALTIEVKRGHLPGVEREVQVTSPTHERIVTLYMRAR